MKRDRRSINWLPILLGVPPVLWMGLLLAPFFSDGLIGMVNGFSVAMQSPFRIVLCEDSLKAVLAALLLYGIALGIGLSSRRNYRRGEEHGSARWGNVNAICRKYQHPVFSNNLLLTRNIRMSLNVRRHLRNLNVLIIGGSGAGKTRGYGKPNVIQCNSSLVILDPNGTYQQHKLSGYLFCADCGSRMGVQSYKRHKGGDPDDRYYAFRCGAYGQKVKVCSAHYVSADAVEGLILSSITRLSKFVIEDEEAFAEQLRQAVQAKLDAVPTEKTEQLENARKRYDELDVKLRNLYENFLAGLLPERQYKSLMVQYDKEQTECEEQILRLTEELETVQAKPMQKDRFIKMIRKHKEPTEVTEELLHDLVDKIVVHEASGGRGRNRTQEIEIFYKFIGQFELAFSPAEIKAAAKQEAKLQRTRKAMRKKATKKYLQKKKRERYAERDGHKYAKRVCEYCGAEYWPNNAVQRYCTKECVNAARAERVKAQRYAEKGEHTFRQKKCIVCGKPFWPVNGQEVMCSEECKKLHRNERQLACYHDVVADKEKAKRDFIRELTIAENDGHLYPKRVCEYCGEEFWPEKHFQRFCCKACTNKAAEMRRVGIDPAEKEGHPFHKKVCPVCGKEFWPEGPNTKTCSEQCRHEHGIQKARDWRAAQKERSEIVAVG